MTKDVGLMQQGIDSRAMFAVFVTGLPGLLLLAAAGAILGSGLHLAVAQSKAQDACYVSETEYYIEFAEGRYEMRDHYNAFTWNDVLGTELVLGKMMELLGSGYDANHVKSMLRAEMLSDVRYLTIFVSGQDPAEVEVVKDAVGAALEALGARMSEFDAIYKIEDLEIVQEKISFFGWRAAFLGAAVAACAGAFVTAFRFCMGSVFYTKGDIAVRLGIPACGMTFRGADGGGRIEERQAEMLAGNLKMLSDRYARVWLVDASGGQAAEAFLQDIRSRGQADGSCFEVYRAGACADADDAVMAVIPFGVPYRERILDEIGDVQLHGGRIVSAVLVQAKRRWMRIYYACGYFDQKGL